MASCTTSEMGCCRHGARGQCAPGLVGFTTAFDRAGNKLYERALHAEDRSSLYEPYDSNQIPQGGYDSLDRLLQYQRGVLRPIGGDGGNGGGSIVTPIALPNTDQVRTYALDSLGNWRNTVFTPEGGSPQTETRQHNGLNEITRISNPTISELANPSYDLNGNLTNDGTFSYVWDALNRLVAVNNGEEAVGGYYYDALNRRIRKTVGSTNTDFIYSGWRCFEDRNPNGGEESSTDTPIIQYLWGIYLDEVLQITTLVPITTGSGETAKTYDAGTYYALQDLLYRTTATVTINEESAVIQEAYDFDAYGRTLIFNAAGTDDNWWADNAVQVSNSLCQFLFTGQRFDAETGLYYYKRRYYSPVLGRFLSRDPELFGTDAPNLQAYAGSSPSRYVDPIGKQFESSSGCGAGQGGGIARVVAETGQCMMIPPNPPPPTPGASCNIKIRCGPVMSGGWHCGVIAPNGVEYGLGGTGGANSGVSGIAKPYPPEKNPKPVPAAPPQGDIDCPVSCPGQTCAQVQQSIQNYHDNVKPPPSPCGPSPPSYTYQPPPTTTPPNTVGW